MTILTRACVLIALTFAFILVALAFASRAHAADAKADSSSTSQNSVNVNAYAIAGGTGGSSGGTQRIETTPDVNAPMISGGNPCVVGMSAGISVTGFGITGGGMYQDEECELRQQAALLMNMGLPTEAMAILCQNDAKMQKALAVTGKCTVQSGTKDQAPPVRAASPGGSCYVKPGTSRTVVTDWPDRMACARSLGLR